MAQNFDLRAVSVADVRDLFARFHGYGGCGRIATYAFAVFEQGLPVAAYLWQPPAPAAARAVAPHEPAMVLALSRMVAVPKTQRELRHISKPLRRQMRSAIDRTRWPVLVTYSDEGQGHTGHVYKCSGWQPTARSVRPFFVDAAGVRRSPYSNGGKAVGLHRGGSTQLQRWEHWWWDPDSAHMLWNQQWERIQVPGRTWRSGASAFRIVRRIDAASEVANA